MLKVNHQVIHLLDTCSMLSKPIELVLTSALSKPPCLYLLLWLFICFDIITITVIIIYIIIIIIGIIIITGNYTQNSHKMINSETIGLKYPIKLFPRNERNLTLRINFTYFDMYSSVKAAAALEFRTQVVNATSHIIRRKTI